MSEDEPRDVVALRGARDRVDVWMPADAADEPDRSTPRRRLGEHEIGASSPTGKRIELRRPHDAHAGRLDLIAARRMIGVDERSASDQEASSLKTPKHHHETTGSRSLSEVRNQLALLIGHEPRVQSSNGNCAIAAVDQHAYPREHHEESGRRVSW